MITSSVDRVLADLASLKKEPRLTFKMKHQIQRLQMELEFLKMFLWCLRRNSLRKYYVRATVGKGKLGFYRTAVLALDRGKFEDWDFAASKLLQKIELCKQKMEENILHLSDCSFPSKFSSRYVLHELVTSARRNLQSLLLWKADRIAAVKMQLRALIKKLKVVRYFVSFSANECFFSIYLHVWAYRTACLLLMYWLDSMKEAMPVKMNDILYDLLQKVNFYISEVIGIYLGVLKASEQVLFNHFGMLRIVDDFLHLLLPIGCMKILQERLMFLISFLMYPPESKSDAKDNLILTEAHAVASEIPSLFCSLAEGELKEDIAKERNVLLAEFEAKIDTVKAEVREQYTEIPVPSRSNFPKTNALGFIDLLLKNLGNLKEMINFKANFISCIKDQILILYEELHSLWPFLKYIQEKQNVFDELNNLWMRIIDVAYQVEHVIDSCQILDVPIWYNIIRLSDVTEKVMFLKTEIQDIIDTEEDNIEVISASKDSSSIHVVQVETSGFDEVVVGFEDEAEKVINRLVRGSSKLDIVSIVGMLGQGKTTLAKKIYNDLSIRSYFSKSAWCFIGQVYRVKQLLLDILGDVSVLDDEMQNKSQEDLAHKLCQCLRGERYLIVLDDIWDKSAWDALGGSFPDDQNGSRILFTSRNEIVELQDEFGCNLHRLRPLSMDESRELLTQKLFPKDGHCPSEFEYCVQRILSMCNGLPLAVVVVAGMLKRASNDSNQWGEIVQNLNSQLASEECMHILELSYKNLPDSLKPCFLCLATVAHGKAFDVQKLIEVWMAEGFIQGSKIERLNDVAMECLLDLINRSLLIVTKRSSRGKIKECRIHDLVLELCLAKAIEEKFMYFPDIQSHSSIPVAHEPYRICMNNGLETHIESKLSTASVRSLFDRYNRRRYLWSLRSSIFVHRFASLFTKLKFLRVLDMEGYKLDPGCLEEIVSLIFLRYLAVESDVHVLPLSIGCLCNLETFRLVSGSSMRLVRFPHTFWMMKRLRNVHIHGKESQFLDDYLIEDSSELRNLESFSSIYLENADNAKKVLRRLPSVWKLKLKFSVSWRQGWNTDLFDVLNSLRMLESLCLYYYMSENALGSCLFNFPSTLKKLTLLGSSIPWSKISAIAKLQNLEALKLLSNAASGPQWDVEDDEFLNLKFLKLSELEFSRWNASIASFPCIQQVVVKACRFLEEMPCSFGESSTCKRIEIDGCTEGVAISARGILREQQEMGNKDFEAVISNIYYPWVADDASYYKFPNVESFYFSKVYFGNSLRGVCMRSENNRHNYNAVPHTLPSGGRYRCFNWIGRRFQAWKASFEDLLLDEPTKRIVICKPEKRVQKTEDEYLRRVNNKHKNNCQSRQAILNRHFRDLLKRDG